MKKRVMLVSLLVLLTVCFCLLAGTALHSSTNAQTPATESAPAPAAEEQTSLASVPSTDLPAGDITSPVTEGTLAAAEETTPTEKQKFTTEELLKEAQAAAEQVPATKMATALNIGSDLQVVWDDYIIDSSATNATLSVNEPTRRECVMTFDEPWEGDASDYHVIFYDDEMKVYRMYYLGWNYADLLVNGVGNSAIKVCYAESTDGLTWTKPNLGIHSFNGSTNNNIVLMSQYGYDNFFVFKDQNPNCPSSQKYKAVAEFLGPTTYGSLHIYTSPDGYNWNDLGMCFAQDVGTFDSVNTCYYNVNDGYYYMYFRLTSTQLGRIIRVAKSRDFLAWSTPVNMAFTDDASFQLYTNNVQPYYRNSKILVGFPTRYYDRSDWTSNYTELTGASFRRARMEYANRYGLAITDALFMTSRDSFTFNKFNEAWCPPGPENGINWIYGDCYFAYGMIETPSAIEGADNEISMYAFEGKYTDMFHDQLEDTTNSYYSTRLYRYTSRIDGFASYKAPYEDKVVTTKAFTFTGNSLHINFKTSAGGHIYIRVLDENNNPISGYTTAELFGDSTDRNVIFDNQSIANLHARNIKLEFTMSDASLYSFQFR